MISDESNEDTDQADILSGLASEARRRPSEVFTPSSPVSVRELFAGRQDQLMRVLNAVDLGGSHVVIHGERGVGKTSLANIVAVLLPVRSRVACASSASFGRVWRAALSQLVRQTERPSGFGSVPVMSNVAEFLPSSDDQVDALLISSVLEGISGNRPVFIFDEFDRLSARDRREFSDLIKSLADFGLPVTVILVGVSEVVGDLVEDHASVARCLVQVKMPRMTEAEIREILRRGLNELEMTAVEEVLERVVRVSQGMPTYPHNLGLRMCEEALSNDRTLVTGADLSRGFESVVTDLEQTLGNEYRTAIRSGNRNALFRVVLLACAEAMKDSEGYFRQTDVREPLRGITGRPNLGVANYRSHLNEFTEGKRGFILTRKGDARQHVYRFTDPMMPSYVLLRAASERRS